MEKILILERNNLETIMKSPKLSWRGKTPTKVLIPGFRISKKLLKKDHFIFVFHVIGLCTEDQ